MAQNKYSSIFLVCLLVISCLLPAGVASAASSTVTLQATELIQYGTEEAVCYEHGYNLPCQHCACFMAMAEATGGVQYVRADSDGYYLLGFLQEGYLEPINELDVLVINLFVLKTDFSGKVQWFTPVRGLAGTVSYPGDLMLTGDGGCILVQKRIQEEGPIYIEVDRLDASGKVSWRKALASQSENESNPVNVGHDSWISRQADGNYSVLWNTMQGESRATVSPSGDLLETAHNNSQSHPFSYKNPELSASNGANSVTVNAPVTRIILSLEQPDSPPNGKPSGSIPVLVNGVPVVFPDALPYADEQNRVLVPLGPVMAAMGISAVWSDESKQAVLSNGTTDVIFTLNSNRYLVNQNRMDMDSVPVITDERLMLPIRFAAEAFGAMVNWQNNSVVIETR